MLTTQRALPVSINTQSVAVNCPAGQHPNADNTACTLCIYNTLSIAVNCAAGQHPNADNTACTPCPIGWYKGKSGPQSCDMCENNLTTAEEGTTAQKKCKGMNGAV